MYGILPTLDYPYITTKQQGMPDNTDTNGFCYLTNKDVVRHPLVQKIVHAYEKYEAREQYKQNRKNNAKKTNRRERT